MPNYVLSVFNGIALCLIGCSIVEPPSVGGVEKKADDPATFGARENGGIPYPCLVATHLHAIDGEITESSSPVAPALVEEQFSRIDWTKKASIGVHIDASTSLTVMSLSTDDHIQDHLVAIWTQPDTRIEGYFTSVVRHSEPFDNHKEALALLELFVDNNRAIETATTWTIKSRRGHFRPVR